MPYEHKCMHNLQVICALVHFEVEEIHVLEAVFICRTAFQLVVLALGYKEYCYEVCKVDYVMARGPVEALECVHWIRPNHAVGLSSFFIFYFDGSGYTLTS